MTSVNASTTRNVLLLSIVAGSADAIAFLGLAHVFTSNMTGNLVLLGIDLGQGHFVTAAKSGFVLILFMIGVAFGIALGRSVNEKDWPKFSLKLISAEKIILMLFAIFWAVSLPHSPVAEYGLLGILALSMGLQSAAISRLGAPGVGTTAVTSTITAFVTGVVAVMATPPTGSLERVRFHLGVLLLYGTGAAAGGFLVACAPWFAGFLPALVILGVCSPRTGSS